jgi:hypothetical protein
MLKPMLETCSLDLNVREFMLKDPWTLDQGTRIILRMLAIIFVIY